MKNLFASDSPVMKLLQQFTDLIFLNLLWLLGCLPVFTIGASTAALYQCIIRMRKNEEGRSCSYFWKFYKSNFKQATILFFVVALIIALTVIDVLVIVMFIPNTSIILKILFLLPFLLVVPSLGYVFPLQAQFDNSVINTLKNAWSMSTIHFLVSIIVLGLNLVPFVIFFFYPEFFLRCVPIWLCLGGSVIAYANTALLQGVFVQYMPKEDLSN